MDIDHLKAFVAIAELRHFGRAAERLHITQPALTKRIHALEETVGAPLFTRGRRGAELTRFGEFLLPDAAELVSGASRLLQRARLAAAGRFGHLNIGFGLSSIDLAPKLVASFRALYPDVTVTLDDYSSSRQVELLQSGALDLGFVRLPLETDLATKIIAEDRLAIAMSETMIVPSAADELEQLNDKGFIVLLPQRGPGLTGQIAHWCKTRDFTPRMVQQADGIQTVLALVAAGAGHAIVPYSSARFFGGGVQFVPVPGDSARWTVGIAWRQDRDNPALRNFIDVLGDRSSVRGEGL